MYPLKKKAGLHLAGMMTMLMLLLQGSLGARAQNLNLPEGFPDFSLEQFAEPAPGYIFSFIRPQVPKYPGWLVIMDNYGTPIYYRFLSYQSSNFALQPNGLLSYMLNENGDKRYYLMDSSYQLVDSVRMEDYLLDTHDFIGLENGNYLIFGLDLRLMDLSTLVDSGNVAATVKGCVIQELDSNKQVIFEWNSFDHYAITDTYKDLSESSVDYVHPNSLEIDHDGNILLIARAMNEITKIDRQSGEIIWRLGGRNNEFDFADTSHLFSLPHDVQLLENGNYTIFDNGNERNPAYSRAAEYHIDEAARTIELVWEYDAGKTILGKSGGSTRRLPGGNTLVGYGGQVSEPAAREVLPDGSLALELNYGNDLRSGRILKFPWRTTLFEAAVDTVNFGEWDGYTGKEYLLQLRNNTNEDILISSYSLHGLAFEVAEDLPFTIPAGDQALMKLVMYPLGSAEGSAFSDILTLNSDRDSTERVAIQVALKGYYPDISSPVASISPAGDTISTEQLIEINFNEAVRLADDSELTSDNAASVILFRKGGISGEDIPLNIEVNTEYTRISFSPARTLEPFESYYLKLESGLEDYADNANLPLERMYYATPPVSYENLEGRSSRFEVYPNPVSGTMYIHSHLESGSYDMRLYNIAGQLIHQRAGISQDIYRIDLSGLPRGFYLLKIEDRVHRESLYLKIARE